MNKKKTSSKHKSLAALTVSLTLLSLVSATSIVPKWLTIPEADSKSLYTDDEYFSSFTGTYTQWNNTGSCNSLSAIDSDGIGMNSTAEGNTAYQEGYWYISDTNLPHVQTCVLYLYVKASSMAHQQLTLYNQTGSWFANVNGITSSYKWISINVTSTFNTKNKIMAMRLNFYDVVSISSNSHLSINAAYLKIVGYVNVGYTYFKYDHNHAGQTCTFYCKITAASGDMLSQYMISSDNNKNTGTYTNDTAQSIEMVTTKNITWSLILNSTGDRFLDIKIYVKGVSGYWDVSNVYSFFIIPNGLTPDALWARLVFANDTNNVTQSNTATSPLIVNYTFPFLFSGSSSLSNVTTEGLLDNVFLYLQTGNTEFLRGVDLVAKWLNGTTELAYLWSTYTVGTGWSNRDSAIAATEILKLAVYAELQPQWKPLLQKVVNRYREMFLPLPTHRVYEQSGYDNAPTVSTTSMDCQSTGITALTVCSHVLNNMTLKNLAYQMIMNYTVFKLPVFTVSQDNSTYSTFCKEDEVAGYWRESLEAFYYYYPENTTIMNKLYISAFNSQYQWNGRAAGPGGQGFNSPSPYNTTDGIGYFNYATDAMSGYTIVGENFPIHGFGINDESLYAAYLIFGNTTWLERAKQDYYFNVENVTSNNGQGHMINNGLIAHLPPDTNLGSSLGDEAEDSWGIYARRFGAIMYSISGNQSYLHSANMLFLNYSNAGKQTYGIQGHVNCTDHTDYDVQERDQLSHYIIYRNVSITTINSFNAYIAVFGLPQIGLIPTSSAPVLVAPTNNAVVFDTINVQFEYYVPVQTVILNASLWTNTTGTWARSSWNSTPVTTISLNSIYYNFSDGSGLKTYLWTVQLYTDSGSIFAASNYTVNVHFPIWSVTGGTTRTTSLR